MLNLRTLILGLPRTCPQTGLQNEPRYSEKPSEFGTVNWTPYLVIIKLRLPDKEQHLSRKDGYRLIYLVSKTDEIVVFLDIYPKNGPLQQLDIANGELKFLVKQFVDEAQLNILEDYLL